MIRRIPILLICLLTALLDLNALADETRGVTDTEIHGFISQGYMKSTKGTQFMVEETVDGTFEFNEMGLNISKDVSNNLRMGMQFFAFDLGSIGNDEIILDWAFADYNLVNSFGIRAGRIKIPHGLYNETRDIDMLRTSVFMPTSVYAELFRDVFSRIEGAGIYGTLPGGFQYQVLGGTEKLDAESGLIWGFNQYFGLEIQDVDLDYAFLGNLLWTTPIEGLRLGTSWYRIKDVKMTALTGEDWPTPMAGMPLFFNFDYMGTMCGSLEYVIGDFVLAAEYVENPLKIEMGNAGLREKFKPVLQGYYGSIAYRLFSWMETGFYYSEYYFDKHDRDGKKLETGLMGTLLGKKANEAWLKDTCLSVRFDLGTSWSFKVESHLMNGLFLVTGHEGHENWEFYAAKMSYNF